MKKENLKKRYLVILADRKKRRFFTIFLGNFENFSEEEVLEDVPQKIKNVDSRQGIIERHIEGHLKYHLKKVGEDALQYLIKNRIKQVDGIFIGTHKELFSEIKNSLPKKLEDKVLGEFVMEPNAALGDITNKIISKFKL